MNDALDRSPPRFSGALAVGVAIVGAATLAASTPALSLGLFGVVVVGIGLHRGSRALVTLGGAALFGGVLLAGLAGTSPELLLFATATTVIAWDVAEFAIGLGREVGRAAETTRIELVHAGMSAGLAVFVAVVGVLVFRLVGGGPALAPIALLCGAVVLVVVLRP